MSVVLPVAEPDVGSHAARQGSDGLVGLSAPRGQRLFHGHERPRAQGDACYPGPMPVRGQLQGAMPPLRDQPTALGSRPSSALRPQSPQPPPEDLAPAFADLRQGHATGPPQ